MPFLTDIDKTGEQHHEITDIERKLLHNPTHICHLKQTNQYELRVEKEQKPEGQMSTARTSVRNSLHCMATITNNRQISNLLNLNCHFQKSMCGESILI